MNVRGGPLEIPGRVDENSPQKFVQRKMHNRNIVLKNSLEKNSCRG
jgi:hypothetical protein